MGRRSINTTKSGKFMNPTDQARKEARKRELKKNKKQRMLVRMAVLKGKDPQQILEEMEIIDKQEFDPTQPPRLNERVLKDKRKKLRETFDRVINMYEKEDPEMAMELRKMSIDYERRRMQLQVYFEQVKNAERVRLEQIPLPDAPSTQAVASMLPLPGDIPLPQPIHRPHGILKKSGYSFDKSRTQIGPSMPDYMSRKRRPPGPPAGPPPPLSDSEDEQRLSDDDDDDDDDEAYDPEKGIDASDMMDVDLLPPGVANIQPPMKQRKIRFEDDATHDPDAEEKDTRLKYKGRGENLTALQTKMLQIAGQSTPTAADAGKVSRSEDDSDDDLSSSSSEDEDEDNEGVGKHKKRTAGDADDDKTSSEDEDGEMKSSQRVAEGTAASEGVDSEAPADHALMNIAMPAGPPPGLPPGPPPGLPPVMVRPPPMRGMPPGMAPRMLPPGPPRGRPPGIPPVPPMAVPPAMRAVPPPIRMPPGPPGVPPPRFVRPPGLPPSVPPPTLQAPPAAGVNPGVLSAPPSIMKPPQRATPAASDDSGRRESSSATIEAKPQIRHVIGDVTRFMPTSLRVKREMKDAKGHVIKPAAAAAPQLPGKAEDSAQAKVKPNVQVQTKDDAYDTFMKEMAGLL